MKRIKIVFDGSIDDRSKDGKVFSTSHRPELSRYFLFDFDISYGSF
jgi:hypothetical protein